ncbi:alanine racemase [Agreia sp. COWG]|uniref:alanine racemase n=1 Tax=Agreia sp. COWG TaxID=2773266 RepID=UPI001925F180|nr:alanine racemase [Agreia sp. COWG]CAD5998895.1 Alanine racemase [Agreia sp. COWG]
MNDTETSSLLAENTAGVDLVVDLSAVRHNIEALRTAVAPSAVMAVVKNDAYGHGLLPVVRTAMDAGITWVGGLDIPTALAIRESGVGHDIRLFAWLLSPREDYVRAVEQSIDLGVSTLAQLEAIAASSTSARPARVHLKIDTGLHRNGASPEEWPGLVSRAIELERSGLVTLVASWTHIAEASDEEDSLSISRFTAANAVAADLGADIRLRHLAASAAGFARADARFDLVRFGAFLYGLPPGDGPSAAQMGLRQAMTLRAPVTRIDTTAGARRAAIGLGYGDGLPTLAPGRASVAIRGIRRPVTGPLEVDRLWVELDDALGGVEVGDTATLWGPGDDGEQTLQQWGEASQTMSEELVVRLSARIPRRYI